MNDDESVIKVAIFASGQGSNAREIIRYFHEQHTRIKDRKVEIALIVCNKPGAGVLDIASVAGIPVLMLDKTRFIAGSFYVDELASRQICFIVLAGFLWKIPVPLIRAYPERILNIHPALLPHYGGKGMYGKAVHEAVIVNKEKESGITIHYVDELYDHGRMFFQANFNLHPNETPESLANRIHELEHRFYPEQIARWLECKLSLNP